MKSNIWILLLILCFPGCNGFLEESSQDEVRPSTVEDMEQLLLGEVYLTKDDYTLFFNGTDIFTDDKKCNGLWKDMTSYRDILEQKRYAFGWQGNMFDEDGGGDDPFFWKAPYDRIKGCNVVIEYLDKVTGDDTRRQNLKGEAYVMRAYYYLMLANFFGLPYNYGDPEKNPGVPLKLDPGVTGEYFRRNSVAEVYRQIETDLLEADRLLKANPLPRNMGRANHLMAEALLSRMYLYMENWDKALEFADKVIEEKPALLNLSKIPTLGSYDQEGVYFFGTPDEIIWARMTNNDRQPRYSVPPFTVSDDFIRLFDYSGEDASNYGDIRGRLYLFQSFDGENFFVHGVCKDGFLGLTGIRTAEVYLNRAEVYIHKYIESGKDEYREKSLATLNYLRSCRYDTRNVEYTPVNFSNGEDLLNFYKDERRRELCAEDNHRWFDLRRYGMPELKHVFFINPGEEQVYVLEKNSSRYALPIPLLVRKANPNLEPNL